MNGDILMKLVTINYNQVHVTVMSLRRSSGQRSRSAGDGHKYLVHATAPAPETLKGFEPKLIQTFPVIGPRTD